MLDFHTWFSVRKAFLAFCNLDLMSSQAPPSFETFDPRYVNSGTSSRSFPSIFTGLSTLTFNLMVFVFPHWFLNPAFSAHSLMAVVLSWRSLNLLESRAMSSAKSRSSSLLMNFDGLLPIVNLQLGLHHIRTRLYSLPLKMLHDLYESTLTYILLMMDLQSIDFRV